MQARRRALFDGRYVRLRPSEQEPRHVGRRRLPARSDRLYTYTPTAVNYVRSFNTGLSATSRCRRRDLRSPLGRPPRGHLVLCFNGRQGFSARYAVPERLGLRLNVGTRKPHRALDRLLDRAACGAAISFERDRPARRPRCVSDRTRACPWARAARVARPPSNTASLRRPIRSSAAAASPRDETNSKPFVESDAAVAAAASAR